MKKILNSKLFRGVLAAVLGLCILAGGLYLAAPAMAGSTREDVADNRTLNAWDTTYFAKSTKNIGRIWTDKSVSTDAIGLRYGQIAGTQIHKSEGSDFLVALSAMSSTSSLTTHTTAPLDIVLVLDVSGSMSENLTSYTYAATYSVYAYGQQSYYILLDSGEYQQVTYSYDYRSWGYGRNQNRVNVTPMTSANDTTAGRVQFYTRTEGGNQSKLAALKTAAVNFVKATAELNAEIPDAAQQHRIALVKFAGNSTNSIGNNTYNGGGSVRYNYTQIISHLSSFNASTMVTTINGLSAGGATQAGASLIHANTVLNNAREGAQKVVVFFTDGEPNQGNNFWPSEAAKAVNNAKTLKDSNTLVYTVGVFKNADVSDLPANTSQPITSEHFNAYLHGVSSNFPAAAATSQDSGDDSKWSLTLGTRAEDSDYYKVASNAAELEDIFDQIFKAITSLPAAPTHTEPTAPQASGYVTFTDKLGAFMEVKDANAIVYHDTVYTAHSKSVENGITTYAFEGKVTDVNQAYPGEYTLDHLIMRVTPGATAAEGDLVQVMVPAALLPLMHYDIDANGNLAIAEEHPVRILYSVGLKDGVDKAMQNGTTDDVEDLTAYIRANAQEDGTVSFYSNDWSDTTKGGTIVTFTPAATNQFYYFTEDTLLYTDEACTQLLTSTPVDGATYWYQHTYYSNELSDPDNTQVTTSIAVQHEDYMTEYLAVNADGIWYAPAGIRRSSMSNDVSMRIPKPAAGDSYVGGSEAANATATAQYALYPTWGVGGIQNYLGNNGRIQYTTTGALAIAKLVTADEGLTAPADAEFTFNIKLSKPGEILAGTYTTALTAPGAAEPVMGEVTISATGTGTVKLKADQVLTIYGLPTGTTYEVTETDLPDGFTQSAVNGEENKTIVIADTKTETFTNNYAVAPVKVGAHFPIRKVVVDGQGNEVSWEGKDWRFYFTLSGITEGAPMPANTRIVIDEEGKTPCFGFEDVEFSKPGTYTYTITEIKPTTEANRLAGINYSSANYRLEVTITDNGDGTLGIDKQLLRVVDDNNITKNEIATEVVFTNTYELASIKAGPVAHKKLVDQSGGRTLKAGEFSFTIYPVGDNSKEAPTFSPNEVTNTQSGVVNFGTTTFTQEHVGKTFTYRLEELPGNAKGITYASEYYTIEITVISVKNADGADAVSYTAVHYDKNGNVIKSTDDAGNPIVGFMPFTNTYKAEPASLNLNVQKALDGRDWTANDSFSFTITGLDGAPMPANTTISVDKTAVGSFGQITFEKTGVYRYQITENIPAETNGITYDTHVATVAVTVEDVDGTLKATAVYNNTTSANANDRFITDTAAFTNTYQAGQVVMDPSAILVSKTLNGREWKTSDDFSFIIWPDGNIPTTNNSEVSIGYAERNDTVAFDDQKLVYTAAGTYTYYLLEEEGTIPGITYDRTAYRFQVTVADDGLGNLVIADKTYAKAILPENQAPVLANLKTLTYTETDQTVASFTNTYAPTTVTLTGDTALHGVKTLVGRDMLAGETFTFGLIPMSEMNGVTIQGATAAVTGLADGEPGKFVFGDVTFSQPGTYQFSVSENIPAEKAEKTSYDDHACLITVVVTDDLNGQLVAQVTYSDGYHAAFTNLYYDLDDAKRVSDGENYIDGQLVNPGQVLTYSIDWANTTGENATITIEDTIPAGTSFLSAADQGENKNGVVTWSFQAAPGDYGSVSFKVQVDKNLTGGAKIVNQASVNGFKTNVVTNFVPGKAVDSTAAELGDIKTYTITYYNPGKTAAQIIVTDILDENLTFVSAADGGWYNAENRTITWEVGTVEANAGSSVSFQAKLNAKALDSATENTGYVWLGDHKYSTNLITIPQITTKDLSITKTVELVDDQGTEINTDQSFSFKVELKDADNEALGEYAYDVYKDGQAVRGDTVAYGGTITLAHGETAVIHGLPAGTTYTVSETDIPAGYTPKRASITGAILSSEAVEFVNIYSVNSLTKAVLEVRKELTGPEGTVLSANQFSFSAYTDPSCAGTPVATGTNDSKGNVIFSAQTFTSAGTYTFYIQEDQDPAAEHMDYDTRIFTATVVIANNGDGTLRVDSVSYALDGAGISGAPVFRNSYKEDYTVGSFSVEANKILTGRDLEAGEFMFGLYDDQGNLIAVGTNEAAADGESADVTFANMTYSLQTVQEELPETYPVSVILDNAPNAYVRLKDTAIVLTEEELALVLDGSQLELKVLVAGTQLSDSDLALIPADAALIQALTISGSKLVDGIESEALLDGTMKLTLAVEEAENRTFALAKIENGAITILEDLDGDGNGTLTVTDAGFGTYAIISAEKAAPAEEAPAEEAPVEEAPVQEAPAEEAPAEEIPAQEAPAVQAPAESALTDSRLRRTREVKAKSVILIPEGWSGEYTLTIRELSDGSLPGVTYSTEEYKVKVTIYQDGENLVVSKPVYFSGGSAISADDVIFRNSYAPAETGDVALYASKILTGRELHTGEFTFQAYDAANTLVASGTNDAAGKVQINLPSFTEAGEYVYTICEKSGSDNSVIYSGQRYQITVVVTDNTDLGKLEATVIYPADGISFTNRYKTPVDVYLQAGKELTGRQIQPEEFSFCVTMDGNVIATAKNDAGGAITFAPITFSQEGTYELVISEMAGSEIGVTYDTTKHTVTVTVSAGETGALEAKLEGNTGIVFHNTYTDPTPAQIDLKADKTLSGKALTGGEFSFQVVCGGQILSEVTNDLWGNVDFGTITFDSVGVYELSVLEVAGNAERVTYDTTVYTIQVTVTLQEDNTLLATYTLPETGLTFHNTYTPPPGTPDTGDGSNALWLALLAMISAAGAAALLLSRKRKARA